MIPDLGWGMSEWLMVAAASGWFAVVIAMVWESAEHHCAHCEKRVNRRHL